MWTHQRFAVDLSRFFARLTPLRREGRDAPPLPVCSCARSLCAIAHEIAGAACTRSSLRPLFCGRDNGRCKTRAKDVARRKGRIQFVIAIGRTVPDLPHAPETRLPAGHTHRFPRTTFCCKNNSMRSLAKAWQSREQSGVRKMSLFKMQMTGDNCPIIFSLPAPIETAMT